MAREVYQNPPRRNNYRRFKLMSKIIVTHLNPDIDGIASIWLIKRFFSGWKEANLYFVPPGKTYRGAPPDDDPDIIHVDTGMGRFDHHQDHGYTCSAELVLKEVKKIHHLAGDNKEVLERIIAIVNEIDNGVDMTWEDAANDRYEFMLHNFHLSFGLESQQEGLEKVKYSLPIMDMIFQTIKKKIQAEEELKKGIKFQTKWGKAIAVHTGNGQTLLLGEKKGYSLVLIQNPKNNHLKIFGRCDREIDLSNVYKQVKKMDPAATWYLHQSKWLLLNGSRSDPDIVPTKMSLEEVVEILKKVK